MTRHIVMTFDVTLEDEGLDLAQATADATDAALSVFAGTVGVRMAIVGTETTDEAPALGPDVHSVLAPPLA